MQHKGYWNDFGQEAIFCKTYPEGIKIDETCDLSFNRNIVLS